MKKRINGVIVDIDTSIVELFEMAVEGGLTRKMIANKIDVIINKYTDDIKYITLAYFSALKALPHPLYAVEGDIKYAALADIMRWALTQKLKYTPVIRNADRTVEVYTEEFCKITLTADCWSIDTCTEEEYVELTKEMNSCSSYLDTFKDTSCYKYFKWAYDKIVNKENTSGFYKFAIPGIITACGNKQVVINWELSKILQFGDVPDIIGSYDRYIINTDTEEEYVLDVYWSGEYNQGYESERVLVIDVRCKDGARPRCGYKQEYKKKYEYNVFAMSKENGRMPLKASAEQFKYMAMAVGEKMNSCLTEKISYQGLMSNSYVALCINGELYVGKKGAPLMYAGSNIELVNMVGSKMFIKKRIRTENGAYKNSKYMYDIEKESLRLCNITFDKGEVANE